MCVIISALKKKHLPMIEVVRAMRKNPDGFFMAHWPQGSQDPNDRKTIRTLDENDAIRFFREVPDEDRFVMHARIPSRGEKTIDNVHGWEEDGVLFCHNMTIQSLSDMMTAEAWHGTDSEYFFRKIFMPSYRGEHLANPDLAKGVMGPSTERLVSIFCGSSNKFLFVLPDNTVVRCGNWVVRESEKYTVDEEVEVDEVIGYEIGADGKTVAKTKKVKKTLPVEKSTPTVVASNDNHVGSYVDMQSYGVQRWAGNAADAEKMSRGHVSQGTFDDGFDDVPPDEYPGGYGYGYGYKDSRIGFRPAKRGKTEATYAEMTAFKVWRMSQGFNAETAIDIRTKSLDRLFPHSLKIGNGFGSYTFAKVFELAMRVIAYQNLIDNHDKIVELTDTGALEWVEHSKDIVAQAISFSGFGIDGTLSTFVRNRLLDVASAFSESAIKDNPVLPSEALQSALVDIGDEIAKTVIDSYDATYDGQVEDKDLEEVFWNNIRAIDRTLNISVDTKAKSSRDIEKFIKAGVLNGRKLLWIPAATLLSPDSSCLSPKGTTWLNTEKKDRWLRVLNMGAEAAVTALSSLEKADARFVAEAKRLGIWTDGTESKEAKDEKGEKDEKGDKDGEKPDKLPTAEECGLVDDAESVDGQFGDD